MKVRLFLGEAGDHPQLFNPGPLDRCHHFYDTAIRYPLVCFEKNFAVRLALERLLQHRAKLADLGNFSLADENLAVPPVGNT